MEPKFFDNQTSIFKGSFAVMTTATFFMNVKKKARILNGIIRWLYKARDRVLKG